MARGIRILPDHLVERIATGEVVERPASVVKELVENSLDAAATRISIEIRNGGTTEIRVSDNGHGMTREQALLSLQRHATSRIATSEELAAVRTLGFRGEALPSIAAVSRLVLETAARNGEGTRLVVHAGQVNTVESVPRGVGTTVTVRSLFLNAPDRARLLRSGATEARAVSETVIALALAHPEVAIELHSNGKELLDLPSAPELRARIADIWGADLAAELVPVARRQASAAITGLIQHPSGTVGGGRRAYLFVNGRWFGDRHLVRIADRSHHAAGASGIRPSFFLFLDLPDGEVDLNVHPAKAEVRFRDPLAVERVIEEGIRTALQPLGEGSVPEPGLAGTVRAAAAPRDAAGLVLSSEPARSSGEPEPQMSLFVASGAEEESPLPETGLSGTEVPLPQPEMWQVHNTYIFAETRAGLIIVDQHAAHERVLYEELRAGYATREPATQRLLFPITLRVSAGEYTLVEELASLFARTGFELEPFGGRSVIVHAVPNPHPYFDAERCLREMIVELTEGSPLVDAARTQHERLALSFACKGAIRAGQPLSGAEMTELFDRLFATELPYQDLHGRPTVIQLPMRELHDRFRRGG